MVLNGLYSLAFDHKYENHSVTEKKGLCPRSCMLAGKKMLMSNIVKRKKNYLTCTGRFS